MEKHLPDGTIIVGYFEEPAADKAETKEEPKKTTKKPAKKTTK